MSEHTDAIYGSMAAAFTQSNASRSEGSAPQAVFKPADILQPESLTDLIKQTHDRQAAALEMADRVEVERTYEEANLELSLMRDVILAGQPRLKLIESHASYVTRALQERTEEKPVPDGILAAVIKKVAVG